MPPSHARVLCPYSALLTLMSTVSATLSSVLRGLLAPLARPGSPALGLATAVRPPSNFSHCPCASSVCVGPEAARVSTPFSPPAWSCAAVSVLRVALLRTTPAFGDQLRRSCLRAEQRLSGANGVSDDWIPRPLRRSPSLHVIPQPARLCPQAPPRARKLGLHTSFRRTRVAGVCCPVRRHTARGPAANEPGTSGTAPSRIPVLLAPLVDGQPEL